MSSLDPREDRQQERALRPTQPQPQQGSRTVRQRDDFTVHA